MLENRKGERDDTVLSPPAGSDTFRHYGQHVKERKKERKKRSNMQCDNHGEGDASMRG